MLGRARVGRDSKRATGQYAPGGFNPRARVGRDLFAGEKVMERTCFNPRARVGRDILNSRHFLCSNVFQSTRPRGARLK